MLVFEVGRVNPLGYVQHDCVIPKFAHIYPGYDTGQLTFQSVAVIAQDTTDIPCLVTVVQGCSQAKKTPSANRANVALLLCVLLTKLFYLREGDSLFEDFFCRSDNPVLRAFVPRHLPYQLPPLPY